MTITSRLAALRTSASAGAAPAAPELPEDGDLDENTNEPNSNPAKDKDMKTFTQEEHDAAVAAARADGGKAMAARFNAVLANAEYAGRESLATSLLATDLSAEQIATSLATAPKAAAPAAPAADPAAGDDAARAVMQAAIAANVNSAIVPGAEGAPDPTVAAAAAATAGWQTATAQANEIAGFSTK